MAWVHHGSIKAGWPRLRSMRAQTALGCKRAMERRTVELRVGGEKYRVVSSAGEDELRRLAEAVSAKLRQVAPTARTQPPQAVMLLAAMALAHEADEERSRRESLERRTSDLLRRALAAIDEALGAAGPVR